MYGGCDYTLYNMTGHKVMYEMTAVSVIIPHVGQATTHHVRGSPRRLDFLRPVHIVRTAWLVQSIV